MKSKSCDIRETAIMAVINKTMSVPQAAEVFGVHRSTIYSWVSFFKKEGRFAAKSPTGRKPRLTEDDKNTLKQLLERQKDITIDELTEALGNIVHRSTVHRYVVALGYVYKKTLKALVARIVNVFPTCRAPLTSSDPAGFSIQFKISFSTVRLNILIFLKMTFFQEKNIDF